MAIKGNWGVEIIDTLHAYERRAKEIKNYAFEISYDYRRSCGC